MVGVFIILGRKTTGNDQVKEEISVVKSNWELLDTTNEGDSTGVGHNTSTTTQGTNGEGIDQVNTDENNETGRKETNE